VLFVHLMTLLLQYLSVLVYINIKSIAGGSGLGLSALACSVLHVGTVYTYSYISIHCSTLYSP